jgi:hypothetical protein
MNRVTSLGLAHFKPAATSGDRTTADSEENDLRQLVETELTALLTDETTRRDDQWRRTIDSFKTTLVELEQTCEAASRRLTEDQPLPAAAVSDLVERCVAAAAAERDAAVQRIRVETDAEIRRLQDLFDRSQDLVGRLQAESQTERDKLNTALETIDEEQAARTQVEAALQEAQATSKQVAATLNAQLHSARVELEAERTQSAELKRQVDAATSERAKLLDALQTVRRAVTFEESGERTPQPTSRPGAVGLGAKTPAATTPATPAPKAAETPQPETQAQRDLVAYIDQLLGDLEAIYWGDLGSHRNPSDVVERLTANLRYAHSAVVRHGGSSMTGASALFERQLMALMDAKAETSFARHLGISAYEYAIPPHSLTHPAA